MKSTQEDSKKKLPDKSITNNLRLRVLRRKDTSPQHLDFGIKKYFDFLLCPIRLEIVINLQ